MKHCWFDKMINYYKFWWLDSVFVVCALVLDISTYHDLTHLFNPFQKIGSGRS